MKKIIPYGRQFIDQQDIISVTQSLMKDKITTGLLVDKYGQIYTDTITSLITG